LGIMIEALTAGLGGFGRADPPAGWGAAVFVQVLDPEAFGGLAAFRRETGWFADAARSNPPRPGRAPARLPGAGALQRRREQLENGVALHPTILPQLVGWATKLDVALPKPR